MKNKKVIIFLLIVILIAINYFWIDNKLTNFIIDSQYETVVVKRVIDGDTIELDNGKKVRLLGINTPEKGEEYYHEAKNFLIDNIENKTIMLEFIDEKIDKYNRTLAYVIKDSQNINLEIVKNGLANPYFPSGKNKYYNKLNDAWNYCIENNKNLCEKSLNLCADCIRLKEFDYRNEEIIFKNSCDYSCNLNNWDIKDEGRKHFKFPNVLLESGAEVHVIVANKTDNGNILYWDKETYVWTQTGDTLFLRDDEGKLVLWERY